MLPFQNQPDIEQMKCTQVGHTQWSHHVHFYILVLCYCCKKMTTLDGTPVHPTQRHLLKFAAIFMRKDMEERSYITFKFFFFIFLENICGVFFVTKTRIIHFFCLFLADSLFLRKKNHFIPANVAEAFVSLNIILKIQIVCLDTG